jgi:HPr kinase/phosphorylase
MSAAPIHASAVAYDGAGVLILGPSGSGKSRLAVEMMALGAQLIADDRVQLEEQHSHLIASAPPQLVGVLELHGMGLVRIVDTIPRHALHLAVELVAGEIERLPEPEERSFLGQSLPLLRLPAFPALSVPALLTYIKAMQEGRILPQDWRPGA